MSEIIKSLSIIYLSANFWVIVFMAVGVVVSWFYMIILPKKFHYWSHVFGGDLDRKTVKAINRLLIIFLLLAGGVCHAENITVSDYKYTPTTSGGNPVLIEVTDESPDEINVDFGYRVESSSADAAYSLGVILWNDENNNKIKDAAEKYYSAVIISLYKDSDSNGTFDLIGDELVKQSPTDGNGYLKFDSLVKDEIYFAYISLSDLPPLDSGESYVFTTGDNPFKLEINGSTPSDNETLVGIRAATKEILINASEVDNNSNNNSNDNLNNNNNGNRSTDGSGSVNSNNNSNDNNQNGNLEININGGNNNSSNNININEANNNSQISEEAANLNKSKNNNFNSLIKEVKEGKVVAMAANTVLEVIDNPQIERINEQYAAPATLALVAVNTAAAVPWVSLVAYFQYLFTEPLRFLLRGKRKGWGIVYNALTKRPVDLAIVRLYAAIPRYQTSAIDSMAASDESVEQKNNLVGEKRENVFTAGKLLRTQVTDREGRYNFIVSTGRYISTVTKPNYLFPTVFAKWKNEDSRYSDLYHGQIIEATDKDDFIALNIPIDPVENNRALSNREVLKGYYRAIVKEVISYSGITFALASLIISPKISIVLFCFGHLTLFSLFRRLALTYKPKSWGRIMDAKNKKPINNAIVRIFDMEYNKLLDTQITDRQGRYGFLVGGPSNYYLTVSKEGYREARTDYLSVGESGVIKQDITISQ